MNLNIINNKGVYELHGQFVEATTYEVANYFNTLLDTYYEIVICLKGVTTIDKKALNVMQFITSKAKRRSKELFVLGKTNTKINEQFKTAELEYLFKDDYTS